MEKKIFAVQFNIMGPQIQTQMKMDKVSPQEAIGLLEMAKDQILDKLKKGRQDVFEASKKGE
ncbi:MAG: hypothetical protein KJ601_05070 [Nanoarchaeota archaeon]|nr:hypothetical protein [Nanoarchaeota archaeon]